VSQTKIIDFSQKKKKKKFKKLIPLIILVLIGVWMFKVLNTENVKTYTARVDTIQTTSSGFGIVIRNEQVINAPTSGKITYFYPEGVRVRKNEKICEILKTSLNIEGLKERLSNITQQIKELEQKNGFSRTDDLLQQQTAVIERMRREIAEGNLMNLSSMFRELEKMRNGVINSSNASELTQLYNEKQIIENQLQNSHVIVKAPVSGVISYKYDGLEKVLNPFNLEKLEISALEKLNSGIINLKTSETKDNAPIFRIADNLKWYLAVVIPEKDFVNKDRLKNKNFKVDVIVGEKKYSMLGEVVFSKKDEREHKILLVFEMNETFDEWVETRKLKVEVKKNKISGVCVPVTAIVNKAGKTGVYVMNSANGRTFKEIQVIGQNDEWAVVEGIKEWEKVVAEPKF